MTLWQNIHAFVVLRAWRVAERSHSLLKTLKAEPAETWNVILAFAWLLPLLLNPRLLSSSLYLAEVDKVFGKTACIGGFGFLFGYWLIALLFAAPSKQYPPGKSEAQMWRAFRVIGLFLGMFVWAVIAIVVTLPGMNPGTVIFGGLSCFCAWVFLEFCFNVQVDRQVVLERADIKAEIKARAIRNRNANTKEHRVTNLPVR